MRRRFFDLTFTPAVQAEQTRQGSRAAYAAITANAGGDAYADVLTEREVAFIKARDSFYLASVSETGWPYVQHRGGPAGVVRALDKKTLGWAEFAGNRQYVSVDNTATNDRVAMFFMDYPHRQRLKVLGHIRAYGTESRPDLAPLLGIGDYKARVERFILITVEAFDWNCSQHITPRFIRSEIEKLVAPLKPGLPNSNSSWRRASLFSADLSEARNGSARPPGGHAPRSDRSQRNRVRIKMTVEIQKSDTAVVFIDPQNDVLSEKGANWGAVAASVTENGTIGNMERIFKAAKANGYEVFISPHYFYPTDTGWKMNGPLEADEFRTHSFARNGALNLTGFLNSGADWLDRFKPYIEDGKTIVVSPHKVWGPQTNDLVLQLRKRRISKIILGGMLANMCVESHLRELLEQGFEVAIVKDATAGPRHPVWGDGYQAAIVNYQYLAHAVLSTNEAIERMRPMVL
jgi:predicted pyridoxine 5'-phosphate oxidase superfamily flavin-nucleotide-binding protein/nicotinamidase-related amidase